MNALRNYLDFGKCLNQRNWLLSFSIFVYNHLTLFWWRFLRLSRLFLFFYFFYFIAHTCLFKLFQSIYSLCFSVILNAFSKLPIALFKLSTSPSLTSDWAINTVAFNCHTSSLIFSAHPSDFLPYSFAKSKLPMILNRQIKMTKILS